MLNHKRFYEKRSILDTSFKEKIKGYSTQHVSENLKSNTLNWETKNPIFLMSEKDVKGYFALSHLLMSNFLLFNSLFWSSIKVHVSQK